MNITREMTLGLQNGFSTLSLSVLDMRVAQIVETGMLVVSLTMSKSKTRESS